MPISSKKDTSLVYEGTLRTALESLKDYKNGDIVTRTIGLCTTTGICDMKQEHKHEMFSSWAKFSGDVDYPVTTLHKTLSPGEEYELAQCENGMMRGKYGELRMELCGHCIKYITKLLEEVERW